ncbi:sensor histidine kinase [Catenuloplanes atrovinosus]|uniref:histidine kinase n=1 Tax=Catenuloplanes atrovinosus TaxID=137266 RepID=A0AAE4CEA5_9ACTN|nr:ATP-binding protein [Catenuloplanes atrovinosus]MDR7279869.1 signal transduction histidine kinase [Catenuloplanes atrovinosus]
MRRVEFPALRVQGRLALVMAVPLLGLITLAVPVVVDRMQEASRASGTAERVIQAGRVGAVVQALQQERLLSVAYVRGLTDRSRLELQTARVTDWTADLRREGALTPELTSAADAVGELAGVRREVLDRTAGTDAIGAGFGQVITRFIDGLRLTEVADGGTAPGRRVLALDAALRVDEEASAAAYVLLDLAAGPNATAVARAAGRFAALDREIARFRGFADAEQTAAYESVLAQLRLATGDDFFARFAADPAGTADALDAARMLPFIQSVLVNGRFIEDQIARDVGDLVVADRRAATTTAYLVLTLTLLLTAAVGAAALITARRVTRPLLRLTETADRVARLTEEELTRVADDEAESTSPVRLDPLRVRGDDEVSDLAHAFNRVQSTAARLVERQVAGRRNVAQMFGHIGRRTENLVDRQLSLIDALEREETDPARLENLYRLDHMASRLRRNASSLVALSGGGTDAGQHSEPMPLLHVVRLALGQIEGYPRVDVDVPDTIDVLPPAIADLTLVIAELMENACTFSPPDTRVTVTAAPARNGVRLIITDHGLGLPPERLEWENTRLARRERLDLAPTEVLGLLVVGRLSRRQGMPVTLSETPGGGVTATVLLGRRQLILPEPEEPQDLPAVRVEDADSVPGVEAALLDRASRSLEAGPSWNAFAISATAADPPPVPDAPAPVTTPLRVRPVVEYRAAPAAPLALPGPRPPSSPLIVVDADGRTADTVEVPRPLIVPAVASRVEVVDDPPPHVLQAAEDTSPTTEITVVDPADLGIGLRKRVPGATLGSQDVPLVPPRIVRPGTAPVRQDPEKVRELMRQFESGVARGLRAARSDEHTDEGTTR